MKKIILTLFVCVLTLLSIQAQEVVMEERVSETYPKSIFGQNRTHFVHSYFSLGFILGDTEQSFSNTKFGSGSLGFGIRYKLRLNNTFSTGLETEYRANKIAYSPRSFYDKEKVFLQDWRNAWYVRINLGQRGNHMGKGIDLGVWGALKVFSRFYQKWEVSGEDYKDIEVYQNHLKYMKPFRYGFFGRIFWGHFSLYVSYRYSDALKSRFFYQYYNVPAFNVGLEIGIY